MNGGTTALEFVVTLRRYHLTMKGSRVFDGVIEIGLAADAMLFEQFPMQTGESLFDHGDGFKRDYRISNRDHAGGKHVMEQLSKLNWSIDVLEDR
jgi:hypothetical protein